MPVSDPSVGAIPAATLTTAMTEAERKVQAENVAIKSLRPKPAELQAELSAEARHELATERYLLDGFFKAKLQNGEQEVEITDVLIIRNLQAISKSLVDRTRARR